MLWLLAIVPGLGAVLPWLSVGRPSRPLLALIAPGVVALTLALAAAAAAGLQAGEWSGEWSWLPPLVLTARLDPVSGVMALLVPLIALPVVLYAAVHEARAGLNRLVSLLLLFVGAMELLVIADDLLTLLIGWELVGACSWALIAHDWRDAEVPRDAATAFLVTRCGDLGLFLAAMVTFAASGSFSYAALASLDGATLALAAAGLVVAAAAKSAQLPVSFWLFNAMSGPSAVSALLHSATMVAAGAYLLARLHPALEPVSWFAPAVVTVGVATALAGGVVALIQPHVKKLLAGSTSAHYGMMFVAVGAGYPAVAMVYLTTHAAYKSLLFLAAGAASSAKGTHTLARMASGPRLPATALLALFGSAALAGIPPLSGAWTKELVDAAAGHQALWLALGVLLAGGLSAAYALRWQWLALGPGEFRRQAPARLQARLPPRPVLIALGVPALLILVLSTGWLPAVHDAVNRWFGTSLPTPKTWERVAALLLLGTGLGLGWWLATRRPALGQHGAAASAANWLGLPKALHATVTGPAMALAQWLARFDDTVIDGVVMLLARRGHGFAVRTGSFDDRVIDGAVMLLARRGHGLAVRAGSFDDRVIDAAVARTARAGTALAGVGNLVLEALTDGAVEGAARLLSFTGGHARRLETGLAHHYLVWVAAGAALMAALMLIVAINVEV